MTKPDSLHHLAITTADIKTQIAFFSDVLGTELVALYWMHGVKGAWHGFATQELRIAKVGAGSSPVSWLCGSALLMADCFMHIAGQQ